MLEFIIAIACLGFIVIVCYFINKISTEMKIAAQKRIIEEALEMAQVDIKEFIALFGDYNNYVIVKSRQTLEKYNDSSFFKDHRNSFNQIRESLARMKQIAIQMKKFMATNALSGRKEYPFLKNYVTNNVLIRSKVYIIRVKYITTAGNNLANKDIKLDIKKLDDIEKNPELYMSKSEIREIEKLKVETKKKDEYLLVNEIIDKANELKDSLVTTNDKKKLDELISNLFDRTVNSIQRIKHLDGDEWVLIEKVINETKKSVDLIENQNKRLMEYYASDDFENVKKACELLISSQKEFNKYIEDKIDHISKLFGTRISRNETEYSDVYNYIRPYNKTISPFTAEVSANVFGSAENNPIPYVIKNFYSNKMLYKDQIVDLKNLLNELDALRDAKKIIDNYKIEYYEYIKNVPSYVLEDDEDGFYSRLGFAIIDENVLNVEYKFVYTSNGGMAQRSFTIPMNEETITELINQLQDRLSLEYLAKEQRALMTTKLREKIKERDNYTCCICGNSIQKEPNLLLEIDHIIPIAKGGLTVEDNLQTLCWKCNRNKGIKIL